MSLAVPRLPIAHSDRASVVLPTVKCSSCSEAIPLNSLGEHVCPPPLPKAIPQIAQSSSISSPRSPFFPNGPLPSTAKENPEVPTGRRFPTQGVPSPIVPPRGPVRHGQSQSGSIFDIGQVVGPAASRLRGEYPDSPLTATSSHFPVGDIAPLPDTRSGGNAGMAGVGRRAFAAAAWASQGGMSPPSHSPVESSPLTTRPPMTFPTARTATGTSPNGPGPGPIRPSPSAQHHLPPINTSPSVPNLHNRNLTQTSNKRSGPAQSPTVNQPPVAYPGTTVLARNRSAASVEDREDNTARVNLEVRSASAMSARQYNMRGMRSSPVKERSENRFFDKYNKLIGSKNDQSHSRPFDLTSPIDDPDPFAAIARHSAADSLEGDSILPWATHESPVEERSTSRSSRSNRHEHQRYPTDSSIGSATSSSTGDHRTGSSSHDMEVVMTPSQSWDGLMDRIANSPLDLKGPPPGYTEDVIDFTCAGPNRDSNGLEQIGEEEDEEEGERLVFGQLSFDSHVVPPKRDFDAARSSSQSTVTPGPKGSPPVTYVALNEGRNTSPMDPSPAPGTRPKRVCARCGEAVGGLKRFVQRDGVILCEADWKKLYLPSCRRCKKPIEKSAVSSSDGQLKGKWHRACFTCSHTGCPESFETGDFYVHDGKPWCQYHYAEENGNICLGCHGPIEGRCITASGPDGQDQRFHPGHLRCEHRGGVSGAMACRSSMDDFWEVSGGRYCERHIGEAIRRAAASNNNLGVTPRAEKRRTRQDLVGMPRVTSGI